MQLRVGELARRSGLSVRALHHYEQLGLLHPTGRSEGGYRLYGKADVLRLHRLLALRDAGVPLKEIGALLDQEAPQGLAEVLATQIEGLQQQIESRERLLSTLREAARRLATQGDAGDAVQVLLDAMAMRRLQERHFSAEQLRQTRHFWAVMPEAEREALIAAWPALIARARAAHAAALDPANAEVQGIVRDWLQLQRHFQQLVPGMLEGIQRMSHEPEFGRQTGVTPELIEYLRRARALQGPKESP